jgi:Bacterial regulatory protein, Fis family
MPLGVVVPWNEVKRRAIVDALDQCGGNRVLAAQLLGIGKTTIYRMARACNYRPTMSIILFYPLSIKESPFFHQGEISVGRERS